MKKYLHRSFLGLAAAALTLSWGMSISAQSAKPAAAKETVKVIMAKGTFDVKMTPIAPDAIATEAGLAGYSIDKTWHGDIDGTSKAQMLATQLAGEAGLYIALEKVTATIAGRKGTFMFEHRGYMVNNVPDLSVKVVPGSGTGELTGISGKLDIKIEGGKHFYEFEYSLPATK